MSQLPTKADAIAYIKGLKPDQMTPQQIQVALRVALSLGAIKSVIDWDEYLAKKQLQSIQRGLTRC